MSTIERVAVPVNWTPESDRALVVASTLARWAGVGVELVTVAEPIKRTDLQPRLEKLVHNATSTTTWRIVETGGPPEAALLAELARDENRLWCVGSHARGALGELLRGSLSEDFVRHAHVPVMLVGPHVSVAPTGRVVAVALDGTEQSESILPAAAELAVSLGMTVRLLQVAGVREHVPPDLSESAYISPRRRPGPLLRRAKRWTMTSSTGSTPLSRSPATWTPTPRSGPLPSPREASMGPTAYCTGAPPSKSPTARRPLC